jgi:hypothetical protein
MQMDVLGVGYTLPKSRINEFSKSNRFPMCWPDFLSTLQSHKTFFQKK